MYEVFSQFNFIVQQAYCPRRELPEWILSDLPGPLLMLVVLLSTTQKTPPTEETNHVLLK